MIKDFKLEIVENKYSIKIENIEYFIYESYIKNGTGYTFRIYTNSKCRTKRENYFITENYDNIVVVGKKYNYLLIKKKDSFEYDITLYNKDILKLELDYTHVNALFMYIYINDKNIASYYGDINNPNKIFLNEIELCKKIIRKKKIIKLNDNMVL
jgi:hypothetical protein